MRKIVNQKFWSHGTPLGSLGPLSFEDLGPGSCQCQIPVIWGPYEYPVLVACHVQAEKLKSVASRCDIVAIQVKYVLLLSRKAWCILISVQRIFFNVKP